MSSSEERALILNMLQEGKITVEEAVKLLDAIEAKKDKTPGSPTESRQKQPNFQDEIAKMRKRITEWSKEFKSGSNQKDFDRIIEEFVNKVEVVGRNLASTTFGIVDKVIDYVSSFIETNAFNIFGSYKVTEKEYKFESTEDMDVFIEGVNGYITLKKHQGNEIIIKSKIRSPQDDVSSIVVCNKQNNLISLKINKQGNLSVSNEVLIPAHKFNEIRLITSNGKIHVEDAKCNILNGITKNGHVELMGVNSDKVIVHTQNAKINISYMIGRNVDIITRNSVIDIKHIKAAAIKAVTKNGRIIVEDVQNYEGVSDLSLLLSTTNGGIKVNLNDVENRGYKVNAKTTNGGINLLIPEMVYNNLSKKGTGVSSVEAVSSRYQECEQKITIDAETTNGHIEIVK